MLKVLDLFAGIGGFSLGLERTGGFETVAFCEIDTHAQKVLKKNWPGVPIFEDVSQLIRKDIHGTIDVITGGFPCQDISLAGKGAGLEGARSGLWWEYHRIIKEFRPQYVIAENVSALRSRGLEEVIRSLSEIGYVCEWHCIPASAVGALHRRDRVWLVAYPYSVSTGSEICSSLRESLGNGEHLNFSTGSGEAHAENMAHSCSSGLEGLGVRTLSTSKEPSLLSSCSRVVRELERSDFWAVEPNVGRVANGISGRAHRIKQLGNAVVPQIPEMIGRAILEHRANLKRN